MLADTLFDWLFYRGQGDEALSLRESAVPHFFHFSSILHAEIRLPKSNGLEILRENVTLGLATSLSYVTAGTHSLFLSFNPHSWPQTDMQRGH
jgi:hypothetical protein